MTCVCCSMGLEDDPDLERTCGVEDGYPPMADECEPPDDAEPSLGSFDRVVNQEHSYRQFGWWFPGCEQRETGQNERPRDQAKPAPKRSAFAHRAQELSSRGGPFADARPAYQPNRRFSADILPERPALSS
jgi:hypothetical protein